MRAGRARDRRERGVVMVVAALAAVTLILFAALAIDVGLVWSSRTQSQNVADASALAAAAKMITPDGRTVTLDAGRTAAQTYAQQNSTVANPSVTVPVADIEFGFWNLAAANPTLDTSVDQSDPNQVTGARVTVRMDGDANQRSPTFLAQIFRSRQTGDRPFAQGFDVANTAVGYLGFQGSFGEGEFDLPIAIDSCDINSENGCGNDFCDTISSPPNPCALNDPQAGDGDVTCLEFSSTGEQNACWTVFDGDSPTINNPTLRDRVDNGNPEEVEAGDEVYLDNGDKSVTVRRIRDKFYGDGDYNGRPAGTDRYPPFNAPPKSDSWVVKLPVVECQDEAHCAGGSPFAIVGGVCFEVREVLSPPYDADRVIKGRFLCPTDPLFDQYCRDEDEPGSRPGGCNFGFRAKTVVLVE